jgi:SAM-dependent methyltransferase
METKTFAEFEHAGWQSVASPYHDYFGSLTQQAIAPLIDSLALSPNSHVLDIATGPGYVARELADRSMKVTALDFSSVMIENARRLFPHIQFQEGDAQSLPFPDNAFDAATMNFGILHLDRPEDAIKEAHRVIKKSPGCRFAFSCWTDPVSSVAFGLVLKAIKEHGDENVPIPPGPPFFRFGNPDECKRVLKEAGFQNLNVQTIDMLWRLESVDDLFDAFYGGTPRTGGLLRAQTDENLLAVKAAVKKSAEQYLVDDHIELPMSCIVASGATV